MQKSLWAPEFGTLWEMKGKDILGNDFDFSQLEGKVALLVNVACDCGYTKSGYTAMSAMYDELKDEGFVVLGFPSNQFGGQESRAPEEIVAFTKEKYDVNFPLLAKADVNGDEEQPVYTWLKKSFPGDVTWNFASKFLVNAQGIPIARFEKESWDTVKQAVVEALKDAKKAKETKEDKEAAPSNL